ncbi:MAG: hypothetical protein ACTSP1_05985 [Candidatus Freyarchaeota archaeon]
MVPYLNPSLEPHAVDMLVVEGTNVIRRYAEEYGLVTVDRPLDSMSR